MFYYIDTIEQIKGEENTINEYGSREKIVGDYQTTVLPKFFEKCKNVSADIGKNHYYMDIRIVDSNGGVVKKDKLGEYVESNPVPVMEG